MTTQNTRRVVSRIVMDQNFRTLLFNNPDKALSGYDLTVDEISALRTIPAETIDDFANHLDERISMSVLAFGADAFGGEAAGGQVAGSVAAGHVVAGSEVYGGDVMGVNVYGGEVAGNAMMGGQGPNGKALPTSWLARLSAALGFHGTGGS